MPRTPQNTPEAGVGSPAVRRAILETVCGSERKVTPRALETALGERLGVSHRCLRTAVRALVTEGELTYTSHFGCSFIEPSFQRPVLISDRVVVKPPACRYLPRPDEVVVNLAPGSSFGAGDHPTTRLALQGIERLADLDRARWAGNSRVLDVGTGSGILVIAAVLFGLQNGIGIDTDPCARSEARHNIALNRLEHRVVISDEGVETLTGKHTLVTANLRYPTLARLADHLAGLTVPMGGLVLSGIRPHEIQDLKDSYLHRGFQLIWSAEGGGWGGLALRKHV